MSRIKTGVVPKSSGARPMLMPTTTLNSTRNSKNDSFYIPRPKKPAPHSLERSLLSRVLRPLWRTTWCQSMQMRSSVDLALLSVVSDTLYSGTHLRQNRGLHVRQRDLLCIAVLFCLLCCDHVDKTSRLTQKKKKSRT